MQQDDASNNSLVAKPVFNEQKVMEAMQSIDTAIMQRPVEDLEEIRKRLTDLFTLRIERRKIEDQIDKIVGYT